MSKLQIIIIIFLIITNSILSQKVYTVSNSISADFTSIDEVNNSMNKFLPGDKILFRKGDIFDGGNLIITTSGSSNSPILFGSYGEGNLPIFKTENYIPGPWIIQITGNYINIENIRIIGSRWIKIESANYVTINSCDLSHYKTQGLEALGINAENPALLILNSDYFTLSNSSLKGNYNSSYQDMIMLKYDSQYALIEGNYIDGGSHVSIYIHGYFTNSNDNSYDNRSPNNTIIRNNHFYNHSHNCIGVMRGAWKTIIENNYFERAGTGIDSSKFYNRTMDDGTYGSAIYMKGSGILRNNIITNSGKVEGSENKAVDGQARFAHEGTRDQIFNQAIYNNLFWGNWSESYLTGVYVSEGKPDNLRYENIEFVNNLFGGRKTTGRSDIWIYKSGTTKEYTLTYKNNSFEKNEIRINGGSNYLSIKDFNANKIEGIIAKDNINITPNFVAAKNIIKDGDTQNAFENFSLSSNSKLIDSGTYLSEVSKSSSGNSITLKTGGGKFFFDGWNRIDGDIIWINGMQAQVRRVEGDIITLDKNLIVSAGAYVTLPFEGNMPDIGLLDNDNYSENNAENSKPAIIQQPTTQLVSLGNNVNITVTASSPDPIGYQWWKSPFGSFSESKIVNNAKYSGATTNTLTIKNISHEDANEKYVCEVYNKNDPQNLWVNSEPVSIILEQNLDPLKSNGLKVFLEAVYDNGQMKNNLGDLLPKTQPYNTLPWNLELNETIDEIKANYIDWVIIELRRSEKQVSYRKPGIITDNGFIFNSDGTKLSFKNVVSDKYYIAIKHRNHLGIMSSLKVDVINNEPILYDFTAAQNSVYGVNSMAELGDGNFGLYSGDADANGVINNLDFGKVANNIPFKGYSNSDLDMNGSVNVLDYNKINKNILKISRIPK